MEFTHSKQVITRFAMAAIMGITCSFSATAQDSSSSGKEISVTAVGLENTDIVFNLKHLNSTSDKISLSLTDEYGTRLYTEIQNAKNFEKRFKINSEVGKVILLVRNTRTKAEEKFEISPRTRMIEDISISSVN